VLVMPSDAFRVPHGVERIMRQLNRNLMFGVLSYNPRTAAIQPSSIVNTLTEIGPKYTMQGVMDYLQKSTENMDEAWDCLAESSMPVLRKQVILSVTFGVCSSIGGRSWSKTPQGS